MARTPLDRAISKPALTELIARRALIVVSPSGGKDSMAMLNVIAPVVPQAQMLVVHASLGDAEWPGALDKAEQHADAFGVRFVVARAVKTFFDMVEHRYLVRPGPNSPCWPSAANRQCTSDLKRGPIEREVRRHAREHGFSVIVSCMGLRAEESARRAKAATFRRNERNSVAGRDWFEWLPIHDMTEIEVFASIMRGPLVAHHAYALGNERLSCVFCIMGSRNDLRNGAKHHPDLLARYVEIERRTGYTMHQGRKSLTEICS
jgi:3'-phosphoadenosine 5'-phosphosulfate sulfotransferase (PAPS reductase)/FAD synthetase